eukprot:gene9531-1737_t
MNNSLKYLLKEKKKFLIQHTRIRLFSKSVYQLKQQPVIQKIPEKTKKFYLERDEVFHHTLPSFTGQSSTVMTWSAVEFDTEGNVSFIEIPRSELHSRFNLSGRDVRILVSNLNYPTILSREKAILVDVNDTHAIITEKQCYLLRMKNEVLNSEFVLQIQNAIKHKHEYSNFSDTQTPFEFFVLEIMLDRVYEGIESDYARYFQQVRKIASDSELGFDEQKLHELLQIKNKLQRLVTFVTELYTATGNILQSDEDMAQMYLTDFSLGKPRKIDSHDEVEMLLETFYSQFEDCLNRTKELISSIKSTQDFLNITLDSVRNRMMQFEITMSMGALAISIGTFVAGIFGMNLISHLESHDSMFYYVTTVCIIGSGVIFLTLFNLSKKVGLFQRNKLNQKTSPQNFQIVQRYWNRKND